MLSVFCAPARYVQGKHATEQLGDQIKKLGFGGKALIIAGKHAPIYLSSAWQRTFSRAGIDYATCDFKGECSAEEIERIKELAQIERATIIIGAGGGKVLDTARAVAAELNLPIVNCPTVASSDAPCSALSVVYSPEGAFDKYLFYRRNPDLVLVDTSVIAKAPVRLLVAGMGDALATWFEAETVIQAGKANQVAGKTTMTARALAQLCYETLLEDGPAAVHAVQSHTVTPALERLVEANTLLSGLGFESGGLAVAHSVHNGLTVARETHYHLHGEKVAFGLLTQLVLEGKPQSLIDEVMEFSSTVGLPITLAEVGLKEPEDELIASIAKRATADGETAHNEPFPVTADIVEDAIIAADELGKQWKKRHVKEDRPLAIPAR